MAAIAFPSYAYNLTAPPQIVASQAAFNALGAGWALTPFPPSVVNAPADVGFTNTDIRLQQMLDELRVLNILTQAGFGIIDNVDGQGLRADITAQDIALAT